MCHVFPGRVRFRAPFPFSPPTGFKVRLDEPALGRAGSDSIRVQRGDRWRQNSRGTRVDVRDHVEALILSPLGLDQAPTVHVGKSLGRLERG